VKEIAEIAAKKGLFFFSLKRLKKGKRHAKKSGKLQQELLPEKATEGFQRETELMPLIFLLPTPARPINPAPTSSRVGGSDTEEAAVIGGTIQEIGLSDAVLAKIAIIIKTHDNCIIHRGPLVNLKSHNHPSRHSRNRYRQESRIPPPQLSICRGIAPTQGHPRVTEDQ